jgi:polyribonucleotide nucleotidyltransferase
MKVFSLPEMGLEVEIGKFARQADGAVWIKAGNNIVLATAVATKDAKEFVGFFPLTVEYRERPSAAGKIPGGYVKREGKLSDAEVLSSRNIDRPIRPLFPPYYFNEVQILCTVFSSDGKYPAGILSILGASLALTVSPIPFLGPIGAVQASKVNGKWKFNAAHEEIEAVDSDITIAGTHYGICMVEGNCNEVAEAELIDLLFDAHELIKKQIAWQLEIQKELNIQKEPVANLYDWDSWKETIKQALPKNFVETFFHASKKTRSDAINNLQEELHSKYAQDITDGKISAAALDFLFELLIKENLADVVARKKTRFDLRDFGQVRPIFCEVGLLPCTHGSAVFQRGETQALASLTLGTTQDAQKVETLLGGTQERSFMLHYNFPPFATGEVKPIRGAGRREIGHGYLAETSFLNVTPKQEDFPYTIRSVADILESNGSSSMATVCATTLALMDAGVPIKSMIGGVAMGLLRDSSSNYYILTDIIGDEDAFGLMDFKVTGTDTGIMAFQLDIKDKVGLPREIFAKALEQAKQARLHILKEMRKVLAEPRKQLSANAPRVLYFKVPTDKIGTIIGPAGKIIKEIIAKTLTQIDISDDGGVKIYSKESKQAMEAEAWIKILAGDIEIGSKFNGIIRRIAEFGIFVELVPGKEGLVHVSTIARSKQRDFERKHKIGDTIAVRVTAYDKETDRIRLIAPELERP